MVLVSTCVKRKIEYSLDTDLNGRMKVPKLGTKEVTVSGIELSSNQILEFLENFNEEKE